MRDASGVSADIVAASRVCDPKAGPQQKKPERKALLRAHGRFRRNLVRSIKLWELGYLVPIFLRAGDNLGDYRRLFYGPGDGFQNNPGFPRMNFQFGQCACKL